MFLLFGSDFGLLGDARALTQTELTQHDAAQAHLYAQAKPSLYDILAMANYRPAVVVPQGWADWYKFGMELV